MFSIESVFIVNDRCTHHTKQRGFGWLEHCRNSHPLAS
jgi:hypothetical protein